MSVNNLQEYIKQLEIRIQLLKQQVETLRSKISEVEKEFSFRSNFLEKEVAKEIANVSVHGLELVLPVVQTDHLNISVEDLQVALQSLFKLN
jgi:predicted nuclease with TOPRIM domain